MDRYLYKAKRLDNGEWVQGYLFGIWEKRYILWGMTNDIPNMIEVDPTTICQCTGLKDKNGKLIWENDIVRGKMHGNYGYRKLVGVVQYYIDAFKVNVKPNSFWGDYKNIPNACEVIGDIFDNKELLESEG